MDEKGNITIKYLQSYLAKKDDADRRRSKENPDHYFLKLVEEVGELARARVRGNRHATGSEDLKGSVEEELYDVLYYTLMVANENGVDLEKWIPLKEEISNRRYPCGVTFDPEGNSIK